jgi:RNA polymerase sigma-70 factor (ECF subfamily)
MGSQGDAHPHPPESTSTSLLERVKGKDADAWQRLATVYGPLVYRWCRQRDLHCEDAADVVQEVFAAVATGIAGFRGEARRGTFRAWLKTITLNKISDHFRTRRGGPAAKGGTQAQEELLQVADSMGQSIGDDASEVDDALWRRTLEFVQGEFEDRTCRAFMEIVIRRRPVADVASELGMTLDAVYQAKSRVLRRLRQELRDLEEPD